MTNQLDNNNIPQHIAIIMDREAMDTRLVSKPLGESLRSVLDLA